MPTPRHLFESAPAGAAVTGTIWISDEDRRHLFPSTSIAHLALRAPQELRVDVTGGIDALLVKVGQRQTALSETFAADLAAVIAQLKAQRPHKDALLTPSALTGIWEWHVDELPIAEGPRDDPSCPHGFRHGVQRAPATSEPIAASPTALPILRWLFAPMSSFSMWRRMKLWQISAEDMLRIELQRVAYRQRLRSQYGRGWRGTAPAEAKLPLRLSSYGVPITPEADKQAPPLFLTGIVGEHPSEDGPYHPV